ncbi:MAG TPA: hypothetical protein VF572_00165 [Candidatus Saccharimonadales bacterium]|jgi:transcriptional regulator NrdR family protein
MVCSYCGYKTQTINSRPQKRLNAVWRRRKCLACSRTVTTIEQIDYERTWTVESPDIPGRPFLRDTLLISLHKCLAHRPSALSDASALTDTIMGRLGGITQDGHLTTTAIATLSHEALQRFDPAAATMYCAYHADVL